MFVKVQSHTPEAQPLAHLHKGEVVLVAEIGWGGQPLPLMIEKMVNNEVIGYVIDSQVVAPLKDHSQPFYPFGDSRYRVMQEVVFTLVPTTNGWYEVIE